MQKKIFTLILVVTIGVLVGVAVVKKQAREPLLREILQRQQTLLQTQTRIERRMDTEEDEDNIIGTEDSRIIQKLQGLENRLAALEVQLKGPRQARGNAGGARQAPQPEDPQKYIISR